MSVPADESTVSGQAASIRLVLADDHPIVLDGLVQLFAAHPGFCVVATARNGEEALQAVVAHDPDVLVLDLRMPGMTGLDVLAALKGANARARVVILTATASGNVTEAIRMGVQGVVLKEMAPALLVRAVRDVHAGAKWIEKGLATRALDEMLESRAREQHLALRLTPRQREVSRLVAQGLSNKAIAARLSITEGTVKLHIHRVYEKLGVDGRVALARYLGDPRA